MQISAYKHMKAVQTALTHSTYANKYDVESNQALETVGDGILDHLIAKWLYSQAITNEKDITNIRSRIVSNKSLAKIGAEMGLRNHLRTYRYRPTSKDMADCFEAIVGAISIELGSQHVELILKKLLYKVVANAIQAERDNPDVEGRNEFNSVNRLQEHAQSIGLRPNKDYGYEKPEFNGRTFKIECYWNADGRKISSYGVASRKKEARKKAAFFMLQKMGIEA